MTVGAVGDGPVGDALDVLALPRDARDDELERLLHADALYSEHFRDDLRPSMVPLSPLELEEPTDDELRAAGFEPVAADEESTCAFGNTAVVVAVERRGRP